jgi:hypothetical protein
LANRPINWPVILTGRQSQPEPVQAVPITGETAPPAVRPSPTIANQSGGQLPERKRGRDPAANRRRGRDSQGPRPPTGPRGSVRGDKGGVLDVTIGGGGDGQ